MTLMIPKLSKRPRLRLRQVLTLEELDRLLDVRVTDFEGTVRRLVAECRRKRVSIRVPESGERLTVSSPADARLSRVGLFEAQVQRLAAMDRAEEFLMAKRYEFLKARAAAALHEAGYPDGRIDELLRRGRRQLTALPAEPVPAGRRLLERALSELEALRNRYVEGAIHLVPGCANRYRNLGVDYADLIQEGCASLFQAIDGFDWRRGVRFKTYAQYWIHQAILKLLYDTSRTVRVPVWVQKALGKIRRVREEGRQDTGEQLSDEKVGEKLGMPGERVRELQQTKRFAVSLDAEIGDEDGTSLGQILADDRVLAPVDLVDDGDLGARLDEVMADLPSREQLILSRRFGLHGREPETLGEIAVDLGITPERVRQLQQTALGRLQRPAKAQRLRAYAG